MGPPPSLRPAARIRLPSASSKNRMAGKRRAVLGTMPAVGRTTAMLQERSANWAARSENDWTALAHANPSSRSMKHRATRLPLATLSLAPSASSGKRSPSSKVMKTAAALGAAPDSHTCLGDGDCRHIIADAPLAATRKRKTGVIIFASSSARHKDNAHAITQGASAMQ